MNLLKASLSALTLSALILPAIDVPANAAEPRPGRKVVFISAENEYHAWSTLPAFGSVLEQQYGFQCEYLTSSTDDRDPNRFYIPRMDKAADADLLVIAARRRALPSDQMQIIRNHLDSGKPLIALRTTSHAFDVNQAPDDLEQWKTFDIDVLGCDYTGHNGARTTTMVTVNPEKRSHPILTGVPDSFHSPSWLYKLQPLAASTETLMTGKVVENDDASPEAVVLTNTYKGRNRVVYISLGHWDDFKIPAFNRLLVNSIHWALNLDVPKN